MLPPNHDLSRADGAGRRWADLAAAALAVLTTAASLWIGRSVFDDLPHVEDEFAYLWQAEVMAGGRIALASPPEPEAFLVPFVVDHEGMRFGKYPPGWPAALALGAAAHAPFAVNPILAGIAVWLTYVLGRRLAGVLAGLLAALLTATSPMVLMLAGTLMPHMLSLVMALGWMLAWFDLFLRRPGGAIDAKARRVRIAAAGAAMGLLALTRPWTAVAVALPFVAHAIFLLVRHRRRFLMDIVSIALMALGVGLILQLWQWALTGDPWLNPYTLYWPYDRLGFGPGIGPLPGGHTLSQGWINTQVGLYAWQHDLFGWPYLSWIFVPVGLWALRRRTDAWLLLAVFPSLVVAHLAYWVGAWLLGPRYFVEAVPGLAAISAAGMVWAGAWVEDRARRARIRRMGVAAIVLILFLVNLVFYLPARVGGLHGLFGISRSPLEAFEAVDPGAAVVIVHRNPYWHGYGNLLTLTPPFRRSGLKLIYDQGPAIDARAAANFPGLPVYHYYPDEAGRLYTAPRGE
jgi:4-amino-4-deoxy-L-arabinose transferase-like glycosyltransferase